MTLLQAIRRRHEMAGAVRDRHFHVVTLPGTSSLARCNTSDITYGFCEPHGPVRSRRDISWATVGCRRRKQGNRATCGDAPDGVRFRGEILVSEPEISIRPCRYAAQIEVIITWTGKGELGDNARRGDTSDLAGCICAVEREPEIAIWPGCNVIS